MVSSTLKHTLLFKNCFFGVTDTNILRVSVHLNAYRVIEIKTVFHGLIFWQFGFLQLIATNKHTHQIFKCFTIRSFGPEHKILGLFT